MSTKPRALVIRTAGTNCDAEMVRAFEMAGADASLVHVDRLIAEPAQVERFDLIGFPGGFSYGDDIASGRILAMKLRERLYPALRDAAKRGVPMIGACNGFQVMVQVGLLPGPEQAGNQSAWPEDRAPAQTASLSFNAGGRFIDNWVRVRPNPASQCVWTQGLAEAFAAHADDTLRLPIAHGEGRFVTANTGVLRALRERGQIALEYVDNPNGSEANIAGICDAGGRIFGLMPHPERYLEWTLHPFWTRLDTGVRRGPTPGLRMFQNAVGAVQGACSGA
ncbi:MAG TPA: phosphoribosylformylglycinamidine synthase subunit PurQ [Phycisphaerales bacterium]|nr:phosphoribosylformylglycinamidine synthase subunit PurQ [Phycisphaerales bacterium]